MHVFRSLENFIVAVLIFFLFFLEVNHSHFVSDRIVFCVDFSKEAAIVSF